MRQQVITYALAYVVGRVTLCIDHSIDPKTEERFGAIGPVEHGERRGLCDACEACPT
jgi:hypothetical protein